MDMNQSLEQYAPDKLLVAFKQSSFIMALLISLAIHLVVVGGTSVGYVMDRWVDPEGAQQRKLEAQARLQAAAASNQLAKTAAATNAPTEAAPTAPVTAAPTAASTAAVAAAAAGPGTNDLSRTNTAMMKQLNETAKPEEIPSAPDDLGISIKDTNLP